MSGILREYHHPCYIPLAVYSPNGSPRSIPQAYAGTYYMGRGTVKKRTEAARLKRQLQLATASITPTAPDSQPVTPSAGVPDVPGSLSVPKKGRGRPRKEPVAVSLPSVHAKVIPLRRSSRTTDVTAPSSTAVSSGYASDASGLGKHDGLAPVETVFQHIVDSEGAGIDEDDGDVTSGSIEIEDDVDSDDLLPVVQKPKTKPKASTRVSKKPKASRKKAADDVDDDDDGELHLSNSQQLLMHILDRDPPCL